MGRDVAANGNLFVRLVAAMAPRRPATPRGEDEDRSANAEGVVAVRRHYTITRPRLSS